jgi:hypothetical protein
MQRDQRLVGSDDVLGLSATSNTLRVTLTPLVLHFALSRRAPTCSITISQPARALISRLLRVNTLKVPPPTVPRPQMPIRIGLTMNSSNGLFLIVVIAVWLRHGLHGATPAGNAGRLLFQGDDSIREHAPTQSVTRLRQPCRRRRACNEKQA